MTTNLWLEQFWRDYKLQWNPELTILNNQEFNCFSADGNFEVATKAALYHTGDVEWKPPSIYHSSCEMDIDYFPFDE